MILKFYKFKKFCMDIFTILYSIWNTGLNMFNKRETRMYPDIPLSLAPRFRGRIVLTRNSDGSERCVACNLCAVSCPVDCISLKKLENSQGRWYPEFFRINFARCIFCGMCEEACPTMAIQLIPDCEMGEFERQDLMYEKTDLLISGPGKYPDYNFYNVTGVKIKNKLKGKGDNEFVSVDIKSLLP